MTLAVATPATSMPHTITKNRFRQILSPPAMERKINGRFVSPEAVSTALPKL